MPTELLTVSLCRENEADPWGFDIAGGRGEPLKITEVGPKSSFLSHSLTGHLLSHQISPGSLAERLGLRVEDVLVRINGCDASGLGREDAVAEVHRGRDSFEVIIER